MQFKTEVGVKGEVLLCKKVGNEDVPALPKFKNLILDAFINAVYANALGTTMGRTYTQSGGVGIGAAFRVGSGSTAPDVSDVALVTPLLFSANCTVNSSSCSYDLGTDTYTMVKEVRCEFSPATLEYNLSELAVYTNTNGNNNPTSPILSRTLIKDGLGNPTTLTLAVDEILVIYYTFICIIPRTVTATKIIDGVSTDITMSFNKIGEFSYNNFPFRRFEGPLGATSANIGYRASDFTMPATYSYPSFSGWVQNNGAINSFTPLGVGVGLKQRSRINLNYANSPTVYGIHFKENTGTDNNGWFFKFNPPFEKTDQFVIDLESIMTITRL